MRFGVMPPANGRFLSSPDLIGEYARAAEDAGFESIWVFEHAVIPADYESRYPYNAEGRIGIEDADLPDPLALLADRGARTDEAIEVMRSLWREGEATFHGNYTSFDRAKSNPKPVQSGGPPIHVGGHSRAAAGRAGRLGDGFFPIGLRSEEFAERVDTMRSAARDAGRDPDTIEITYNAGMNPDTVKRYADLGVSRWVAAVWEDDLESCKRALGTISESLISLF